MTDFLNQLTYSDGITLHTQKFNPFKVKQAFQLNTKKRRDFFLARLSVIQHASALRFPNESIYMRTYSDELSYIPLWPAHEFAKTFAKDFCPECVTDTISLEKLMAQWIPNMLEDNLKFGIFPNLKGIFWLMEPLDLKEAIIEFID